MALNDSQEDRMNVVGVGRPWMRSKLPGAKDQQWRIASGNAYGGNTIAAPSAVAAGSLLWPILRRRGRK